MTYIKPSTIVPPKAKLLYIMGATWHNQCMFDLETLEDNFSTLLNKQGIETYTFNILGSGPQPKTEVIGNRHDDNILLAKEIIEENNIDFVMGYSYGAKIVSELMHLTDIKGFILLDPFTKINLNGALIEDGDKVVIPKENIRSALVEYQSTMDDETTVKYLNALCEEDAITTAAYPKTSRRFKSPTKQGLPGVIFFTKNSTEEVRNKFPGRVTRYYSDASHWILLEEQRKQLAADVGKFISVVKKDN